MTTGELGQDALRKKPPSQEDEYFAKQDKARLDTEKRVQEEEETRLERLRQKELHHMRCPKCGSTLLEETHRGVLIDRCGECGGLWLDKGELEQLAGSDVGVIGSLFKTLFGSH